MKNFINGKFGKRVLFTTIDRSAPIENVFKNYRFFENNPTGREHLALQFYTDVTGVNLAVVSDRKTELGDEDLNDIFEDVATAGNLLHKEMLFAKDDRKVYALVGSKKSLENFNPNHLSKNVSALFNEMERTGMAIQFNMCSRSLSSGRILLSVPGKLKTKQKALISSVFKGMKAVPADEASASRCDIPLWAMEHSFNALFDKLYGKHIETDRIDEDDIVFPDNIEDLFYNDPDESSDMDTGSDEKTKTPKNLSLEEMGFSVRTYNRLKKAGINDLKALRNLSDIDLSSIKYLGKNGFKEVKDKLAEFNKLSVDTAAEAEAEASEEAAPAEPAKSSEELLDELIGLEEVKNQVGKIASYARMKKAMEKAGKGTLTMALNTVFTGNPGTAKTTVARILAGIFCDIGLLKSRQIVEVGRADLVAGYVGQTAPKVKDVFEKAKGKLLFIDEAYSLISDRSDFGEEAINTIVQEMENRRCETIVIFAGYPGKMDKFLSRNPGLRSRVPFSIEFKDYNTKTLTEIAASEAEKRGFAISKDALDKVLSLCTEASDDPEFGNGRFCRNLVENAILNFASRNFGSESTNAVPESYVLLPDDFSMPKGIKKPKPEKKFGFV